MFHQELTPQPRNAWGFGWVLGEGGGLEGGDV